MEIDKKPRIQKPVGIYVICLAIIISHRGLEFLYYFWAFQMSDGNVPFLIAFISLFLNVFTVASAVWAMYGDDWSRIVLLSMETLNIGWFLYIVLTIASNSSQTGVDFFAVLAFFMRPLLVSVPILFGAWWFFMKNEVAAYYRQAN